MHILVPIMTMLRDHFNPAFPLEPGIKYNAAGIGAVRQITQARS
jgi:hypothetical protein